MGQVKSVEFKMKEFEYFKPFHITNSISYGSQNIEVIVELDNGIIGYGEASPSFRVNGEKVAAVMGLENAVNEMIVGMDVRNYRQIFDITDKLFGAPSMFQLCNMPRSMHSAKKQAYRFIKSLAVRRQK